MSNTVSLAEASTHRETTTHRPSQARILSFVTTVGFAMAIVLLQLGQGVLLARLLGPVGRGQFAAAVLYSQLLLYIGLMGGLEVVCARAAVLSQRPRSPVATNQMLRLRRASLRLGLTTGSLTALFVFILALLAMPADKRDLIPLAMLCGLSVIGQHVVLIMTAVDRGSEHFTAYNTRRFIAAAAFPLLVGLAALIAELTVAVACVLLVIATLLSMATCFVGLPRPISGRYRPTVRRLLHRSRPYGMSMLATDLFERMDLLLMLWLAPVIEQGFYAAMVPAVYPLTVIPNTLGVYLFNAGADQNRRLNRLAVHRVLGASILVQTITTVVFMLLIGWVVQLVYGQDFAPAVRYALWLAPASAIRGILQGIDGYLKGRGRPMACVAARVIGVAVLLCSTAVLIPMHGVIGIAMAVLLSQSVCLIVLVSVMYCDCGDAPLASDQ